MNKTKTAVAMTLIFIITIFSVFSYGYRDANLQLTSDARINTLFMQPLFHFVNFERPWASTIFLLILIALFVIYLWFLNNIHLYKPTIKNVIIFIMVSVFILSFSYPAVTYDLFNYITTAKVTFYHHENPYLVMPIEIPNEPYLAFTRAANKVALYGPVWILITAIPHIMGQGSIWPTIIMFKFMVGIFYLFYVYFVFRVTKSIKNVVFFAFNPLILIEVIVSGHNDIVMILLAAVGLYYFFQQKGLWSRIVGFLALFASIWIKGATLVLFPLLFLKNISWGQILRIAYYLLAVVFFVVAPLREELYPWYAVWLVGIAALFDMKKNSFLIALTIVLTFSLELRHIPYMWMGYYEGPGPILRTLLTIVPVGIFLLFSGIRYILKKKKWFLNVYEK